ncbi:muts domain V-domain-containing protein [Crassisporium funariophilum]|nr:muts domain V-domain-containing protein [Crassisporium funariophilum]
MKQKSLTSFFSKPPPASSSTPSGTSSALKTPAAKLKPKSKPALPSSSPGEPVTPDSRFHVDVRALNSSAVASSGGGSTPPTSDPIPVDVDMLSADEGVSTQQTRRKRKVVIEDSDEEVAEIQPNNSRKALFRNSSPTDGIRSQAKKPRLSKAISDHDSDEDEDLSEPSTKSFSQRLTRFRKSPVKKDDDDFIVPSDSENDARSTKSGKLSSSFSRSSSRSSRHSVSTDVDEEDDDDADDVVDSDEEPVKKTKKGAAKPAGKKGKALAAAGAGGGGGGGGSFTFLTAAEQREQGKKDDKKAAESPYGFLVNVRDKDKRKPTDPDYDPRTLYIPDGAWSSFTPFEKQIKQNHYDTILFFQKGKFFELYEDDARIGHQQFDLKLTARVKMCMVGVPEASFTLWASKFLAKGYKVGRVEQAETALGAEMRLAAEKKEAGTSKSKGKAKDAGKDKIVRRELNKVYTNGTLVDPEFLTDEQAGHCISIFESDPDPDSAPSSKVKSDLDKEGAGGGHKFGVCVLDCATSQFNLSAFEDDVCRTRLETLMRQVRPKEVLFKKGTLSATTQRILKSVLPAGCLWTGMRSVEGFGYEETLEELKTIYGASGDAVMQDADEEEEGGEGLLPAGVPEPIREMGREKLAIEALGSMIWYLRQLNIDKEIMSMRNFNVYDPMKRGQGLGLDGQTLAHLEVLLNNEGTEEGSLLKLLSRCVTSFGKRLFRIWLCMPLRDISDINARLDAVQDILKNPEFEAAFDGVAKGVPDLERIVARVHARSCKVKDFLRLLGAFKKLSRGMTKMADEAESFKSKTIFGLLRGAPDLLPNIKHVESMFKPVTEDEADELIPQKGKDETFDEVVDEIKGLEKNLEGELKKFESSTGLKLSYWHSHVGNKEIYLVETAASVKKEKIPKDWTKTSGTKAKNRYVVGSLQKRVRQLKEAQENRNTAIKAFKFRLFAEFDTDRALWLRAVRVFAELDCLVGLAKASGAIGEPACRPVFVDGEGGGDDGEGGGFLDFEELRHPTLCLSTTLKNFIPNDVKMGGGVGKVVLLTGTGKSTIMRMTATGVIMAQLGMLVPAKSARLSPVDTIITRMGAYDNMFSNASTFKVELDECCKILRTATPKSLVILDELGRGTSTFDGMAIAGAVLHQLATHTLPLCFFATHYGSLTDDYAYHPNIRTMHMSTLVDDEKQELVFLYKLVKGVAESSFGTHVAHLAGVPTEVVKRADVISKDFAKQFKEKLQIKQEQHASAKMPLVAQADFAYLFKLGRGELQMPEDPMRRREVLAGLKEIVRRYIRKPS